MILSLFRALDTVPISITNKLENKERKKTYIVQHQVKTQLNGKCPSRVYR